MGRRKLNTEQLTCRVDVDLLNKLKSINPSLITLDTRPGKDIKFRHGAIGKYITRLIAEDVAKREDQKQLDILEKFSG